MTKVMICAGEASGDLHGASVADALKTMAPDIGLLGMGGSQMRAAGVEIIYDFADIGVMGFVEIVWNLPKFFRLREYLSTVMDQRRPDVIVLIDYGGFHMALAAVAKRKKHPGGLLHLSQSLGVGQMAGQGHCRLGGKSGGDFSAGSGNLQGSRRVG